MIEVSTLVMREVSEGEPQAAIRNMAAAKVRAILSVNLIVFHSSS